MRIGHNPARFVEKVAQPAGITVTMVNCIPFLSGYYEQSLEVLRTVVESLHATREPEHPFDVMMFDNHSCAEVRAYLKEALKQPAALADAMTERDALNSRRGPEPPGRQRQSRHAAPPGPQPE